MSSIGDQQGSIIEKCEKRKAQHPENSQSKGHGEKRSRKERMIDIESGEKHHEKDRGRHDGHVRIEEKLLVTFVVGELILVKPGETTHIFKAMLLQVFFIVNGG